MKHSNFLYLIVLLILSACTSTSPNDLPLHSAPFILQTAVDVTAPPPVTPSRAITPTIVYQPAFEPAPCAFPVPSGYSPECGYLVVPENRARSDSRLIRLHVAIFRGQSTAPAADPVVHLAGGPGSSSLSVARYMFGRGLNAILQRHDFILFDQRGTGYSQPRLDCPERTAVTAAVLETGLSADESQRIVLDAFLRCRDRLMAEGVDPTSYNSAASAADLDDLRSALGYDKLNLYGVSYGTRLALTYMRDYPNSVRSAVLDSVYPLQVNLYTALAPNAERAFNVFFDGCAADPNCSTLYPDLRNVFYQLVDELNANPASANMTVGGSNRTVKLDGGLLVDVLFDGLYNPAVTASMPKMIFDIRQGDYDILEGRLALYFDSTHALGMQMSVQCAEEFPFTAPEEAYTAAQGVQPQIAAFYPVTVQTLFVACKEWPVPSPDPRENLAVSSDVPTLILAGDRDPITPPEWGQMVLQSLSHAYFYEFSGHGHWVTRSSACALQMSLVFWQDPNLDPGSVCR